MRGFPIKSWKDVVMLLVLVAVAVGFYLALIRSRGPGSEVPEVGSRAPDFTLVSLGGGSVRLSDYEGKVVLLNFWATWCRPCREEMPSMESLYRRLKTREFEILAVSIDIQGQDVVQPFVAKYDLTFPVLLDPDNRIYGLYRVTGVPETFIIDKKGLIVSKIIGPRNWMKTEWFGYLDKIIGK